MSAGSTYNLAIERLKILAFRGAKLSINLQKQPSDYSFFMSKCGQKFIPSHMLDVNLGRNSDPDAIVVITVNPGISKYDYAEVPDPEDSSALKVLTREDQKKQLDFVILKSKVLLCRSRLQF